MIAALRNEHGVFQCRGPFNSEQEVTQSSKRFLVYCQVISVNHSWFNKMGGWGNGSIWVT